MHTFFRVYCLKVLEGVADEVGVCPPPIASHRQVLGAVLLVVFEILGVKLVLHFGHERGSGCVKVGPIDSMEKGMLLQKWSLSQSKCRLF